jgi:hypothetical protein
MGREVVRTICRNDRRPFTTTATPGGQPSADRGVAASAGAG